MYLSSRSLLLLVLLWPLAAWGQPRLQPQTPLGEARPPVRMQDPEGFPFFFKHYTPQEYRQYYQNWAVVQDPRGVVYVANQDGILEYDGVSWRLIETPTRTVVRSLAVDAQGVVYAGLKRDFGYLAPDSTGTLQFVSLLDQVAPADRDVKDIWGTHVTHEGVYFQSSDRLFRWDGRTMKIWESDIHTSFAVNGRLYVREKGKGLLYLRDDSLQLAPGGEVFSDLRIFMMTPYAGDRVLIGTREAGLYLYDGVSATPLATDIDALLNKYRLYHGCALPGGVFALATLDGGGVFFIDEQGRLVQHLDKTLGLDDWVNFVYTDAQGGLWMALDTQGILRVDEPTQLLVYDQQTAALNGIVNAAKRHRGRLYVGTSKGLYVLNAARTSQDSQTHAAFEAIMGETTWSMYSAADSVLFVGTDSGLFAVRGARHVSTKLTEGVPFAIVASTRFAGQLFLGTKSGLALLAHTAKGWSVQERIGGIEQEIHWIAEEDDGTLWVVAAGGEVTRLQWRDGAASPAIDRFGRQDGLPAGEVQVASAGGRVLFITEKGLYRFAGPDAQAAGGRFYRDTALSSGEEASSDSLLTFFVEENGTVWTISPDRIEIARPQPDGSYLHEAPPVLRFPKEKAVHLHVEADGIGWIGNGEELIRYDPHVRKDYATPFSVLVRRITSNGTAQVLYGGAPLQAEAPPARLDNIHQDLSFEVAAPSYNGVADNQYQYYLEGRDEGWSAWGLRPSRSYHNLEAGRYTFRVRARNAQGVISQEAGFGFQILPPWYLTWWAYVGYLLIVLAASALYWRYYTVLQENKRAREQARELAKERHVNERLQQANRRLHEANESLQQVNQLKDEFLANTSHELRTPLTAILGFTAVLKEELPEDFLEFLDPIASNGQRLLNTVNSLLDIAKLRAGMMEVRREEVDLGTQVAEVIRLLGPLAQQKQLLLELVRSSRPLYVSLDRSYLERILYNLIGNAIKFTEVGKVSVQVEQQGDQACLHVSDTGIGIEQDFIPHLFDEFKQESTGLARLHEGSGLGLAITARLVTLMDGEISVRSEKGRGSVFTVSFPVYEQHVEATTEPTAVG